MIVQYYSYMTEYNKLSSKYIVPFTWALVVVLNPSNSNGSICQTDNIGPAVDS